jgi:hypothetical protein
VTRLAWGCSILALLAVIACTAPPSVPDTVSSSSEFTLAIASQRPVYYSTEVIRISAVATYVGEASGVEIWGRGTPVEFLLEEVGGPRRMGAGPRGSPLHDDRASGR